MQYVFRWFLGFDCTIGAAQADDVWNATLNDTSEGADTPYEADPIWEGPQCKNGFAQHSVNTGRYEWDI